MLYPSLLRNQWRQALRAFRFRSRWLSVLVVAALGAYVVFVLTVSGFVFREMLGQFKPGAEPVAFLNAHLLTVFLFLFTLRFFLQRSPQVSLQPYLHLPIPRRRLVRFFATATLASLHNVLPLLFFVPYWARHLAGGAYGTMGPWLWLGGVVGLVVLSNGLNLLARALLTGGVAQVAGLVVFVAALVLADVALGLDLAATLSTPLFGGLLAGNPLPLVAIVAALVAVGVATNRLLLRRLYPAAGGHAGDVVAWTPAFVPGRGPVYNLVLLELKLMWRHKRPRTYAVMAGIFGTVYVAVLLAGTGTDSLFVTTFVGVFASGIFALNYGQLMFSWESAYFDGHLARALDLRDLVRAKLFVLQASCLVFWALAFPIFLWLAPGLLAHHAAFLVYNAGVTSVLMLALGISNQKPVDLGRGGSFLNYEGFSIIHWLWFIPTVVPPLLVLYATAGYGRLGLWLLAGAGAAALLATGPITIAFAHLLGRRRYAMAAGFRDAA